MEPKALRRVKNALSDWIVLKKCLETVFDRHSLKYSTLHGHFLFREQKCDESFSSFFDELWTLCGEMAAIQSIEDKDKEPKVISQFTQGIHDKILRNDVRRYVLTHSEKPGFASWHVLDAAKNFSKDHGVEESYYKSYEECATLLRKRLDTKVRDQERT